ncbi:hypothetical protein KO494_11920 [Lacinutrix sp. C3R15]|uniref:hypothetical protein n=1 Tax=Flavobacteriaceae TaxID=49546 RepID=UPI001C09FD76|nr:MULTISPECIES: hypothetical protein [Flavobacteriaceae]MBU2940245.1 hypothetical protein [Lacinutrix sp. C3R15]MDO6623563.1 hypothetical protein [Oceanihabitans sp. 1_MG-2023]
MKQVLLFFCFTVLLSCTSKTKQEETTTKKVYDMYEPSEMAILMNQMYAHNLKIKNEIIAGKIPTEFPTDFLNIHIAELSDFKSRNQNFQSFSTLFVAAEKEIFNSESTIAIEDRFNNAVNVCVSCHQTECTGPIPRIKKLLIQ